MTTSSTPNSTGAEVSTMTSSASSRPPEESPAGPATDSEPAAEPVRRAEAEEWENRWRRAAADLDNLRKRYERDLAREREGERAMVAAAFLPVVDTIERALEHAEADPRSIVEGVRTMRQQALAVLAGLGFGREDEAGVPFDPARHEVVGTVDSDVTGEPPGSVVAVVRPGYGPPGRQLRPAAVTVARRDRE
jgi:molecular chaperone GrpE